MEQENKQVGRIERTMKALRNNNINAYFAKNHQDGARIVKEILPEGARISCGGSVTLEESGILELMKSGRYHFLDRNAPGLSREEKDRVYLESHGCDGFFTSANAVTEKGELYYVDGYGNRTSAICQGPKKVIVIVGVNKIVPDLAAAIKRVKTIAAPHNGVRLEKKTPCALTGQCSAVEGAMTDGCKSPDRMCVHYLVSAFQRETDRFHVIFLNEELGY